MELSAVSGPDWIGACGVSLLLVAFVLNLFGILPRNSRSYHALNAGGASLACYAAFMIEFLPFVVLEATWATVALVALVRGVGPYTAGPS